MPLPVGPTIAHQLTGLDGEADVLQNGLVLKVSEGHVLESDIALHSGGSNASSRSGRMASVCNMACTRSTPTRRLRDGVGGGRQVLHRLKKLAQVGQIDGQRANGHRVPQDKRRAPPQNNRSTKRDVMVTIGESIDFTLRAFNAAATVAWLTSASACCSMSCASEGLHHLHRLQSLLHHGDDVRLLLAHFVGSLLHRLLEARDEEQQERSHCYRDQGEVPVKPEHQAQHRHNGQHVDQDVEGG